MEPWVEALGAYAATALRPIDGQLALDGLQGPVEILTDRWGVPHVYAEARDDLYFAQGYLHATERLFQVDFTRRLAQGRLAELVSEPGLPTDRFTRTIGIGRAARALAKKMDERSRTIGSAYAAGFRAGVASQPKPVEYQMLGAEPEFSESVEDGIVDGVSISLLMAFTLSANWPFELLRHELAKRLGAERAMQLTPFSGPEAPAAQLHGGAGTVAELIRSAAAALGTRRPGVGSNNWVIGPDKSETGAPLLCNDPHLQVSMPAIWYEVHLCAGEFEVAGVSLPGLPGVVIGHNRRIAWGFTNTQADVEDLYLERLSDDGTRYEHKGKSLPVKIVREKIFVRGETKPRVHEVRLTRHGPLITDTIEGTLDPHVREGSIVDPLAFRWIHYEVAPQQSAVEMLNEARGWDEFRAAARRWPSAGQNVVYADVDGNIGYQFTGTVPIRARGSGSAPLPGWDGAHEWTGTIPFEDLPSALNPARGFIATANHRMTGADYPHYLTDDWEPPYRIRRIVELLGQKEKLSAGDMARIHTDAYSGVAGDLVALFLRARVHGDRARHALERVRQWNLHLDPGETGAAIFNVWLFKVSEMLFRERLGAELYDAYHRVKSWTTAFAYDAMREILRSPEAFWVGGDGSDNAAARDELLGRALGEACADLEARLGADMDAWRWGAIHRVHFQHVLGRAIPPLDELLSVGPFETGGGDDTVNRGVFTPGEDYGNAAVASYRQVIDLGDFDRSRTVITVGQSGNPASPNHHDQTDLWLRGELKPMPFTRAAVERERRATLTLVPK